MKFLQSYMPIILLVVMGVFLYSEMLLISAEDHEKAFSRMTEAFAKWRSCMTTQLDLVKHEPLKMWFQFDKITAFCRITTKLRNIKLISLRNTDEVKHSILSHDRYPHVVVTLGVGSDIDAERELRQLLPEGSEFFGADPVATPNADLFGEIGTFFPVAVSDRSGLARSSIRADNGSYIKGTVEHVHFATFVTEMVNRTCIDFLFMDNEGPEYELIPMIAADSDFAKENITICQINVEFHYGMKGPPNFKRMIPEMLQAGRNLRFQPLVSNQTQSALVLRNSIDAEETVRNYVESCLFVGIHCSCVIFFYICSSILAATINYLADGVVLIKLWIVHWVRCDYDSQEE